MKLTLDDAPKYRTCAKCGKPIARGTNGDLCPICEDAIIYPKVREYIEKNTVTEVEVAEHFDIPLSKVKEWIADGRLTYREKE